MLGIRKSLIDAEYLSDLTEDLYGVFDLDLIEIAATHELMIVLTIVFQAENLRLWRAIGIDSRADHARTRQKQLTLPIPVSRLIARPRNQGVQLVDQRLNVVSISHALTSSVTEFRSASGNIEW